MLLGIFSTINNVLNYQLALSLVDICPDDTLQVLYESLPCFAKIRKINYSELTKLCLVQLQNSI